MAHALGLVWGLESTPGLRCSGGGLSRGTSAGAVCREAHVTFPTGFLRAWRPGCEVQHPGGCVPVYALASGSCSAAPTNHTLSPEPVRPGGRLAAGRRGPLPRGEGRGVACEFWGDAATLGTPLCQSAPETDADVILMVYTVAFSKI